MMRRATAAGIVVLGLAAAILYAAWPRGGNRGELLQAVATAQVTAADFYISLPVQGVLEAARSAPITTLAGDTQIVWALIDGTAVREGELVIKLNPAEFRKRVDELAAKIVEAEEKVRSAQADGEKRVQNARTSLAKAQDALVLAQVQNDAAIEKAEAELAYVEKELAVAQGELEKREQLLEERLVPLTEVEAAQDTVRGQEHSLEMTRRQLERARTDATTTERLKQLDVETAQLELEQAEDSFSKSLASAQRELEDQRRDLEEAQERLDSTELAAPVSGMLLLEQTWEDGWRSLRVGDRVWEGRRIARVIDPTDMLVRCDINEVDIELVSVGQQASVRVPALGDEELSGTVEAIDNLARQRSPWEGGVPGKKVFAALTKLDTDDPRLRPGMGASIEIVLEHVAEGAAVPLEAIFEEGDGLVVYRQNGDIYRPVSVDVGKRSNRFAVVEGAVEVGDTIALERPPAGLISPVESEAKR